MKKNVMLAINGLHMDEYEESGAVERLIPAEYYEKNGSHYLFFTEEEEAGQQTRTRIKFCANRLELVRQGSIGTHMIFEENKMHMTDYRTPFGSFLLGIKAEKFMVEEREDGIRVTVEYELEMNGRHTSDSKIEICIREA